jgi:hypothetical protein
MYENGKMRLVGNCLRNGRGEERGLRGLIKENDGEGEFSYDIL